MDNNRKTFLAMKTLSTLLILALFVVACSEVNDEYIVKEVKEIGFECSNPSDNYQLIYKENGGPFNENGNGKGLIVKGEKSGDLRIYSLQPYSMFKNEGEYYMSLNIMNSTRFTINRVSLKYAYTFKKDGVLKTKSVGNCEVVEPGYIRKEIERKNKEERAKVKI